MQNTPSEHMGRGRGSPAGNPESLLRRPYSNGQALPADPQDPGNPPSPASFHHYSKVLKLLKRTVHTDHYWVNRGKMGHITRTG